MSDNDSFYQIEEYELIVCDICNTNTYNNLCDICNISFCYNCQLKCNGCDEIISCKLCNEFLHKKCDSNCCYDFSFCEFCIMGCMMCNTNFCYLCNHIKGCFKCHKDVCNNCSTTCSGCSKTCCILCNNLDNSIQIGKCDNCYKNICSNHLNKCKNLCKSSTLCICCINTCNKCNLLLLLYTKNNLTTNFPNEIINYIKLYI